MLDSVEYTSKAEFKPTLSAYVAHNFPPDAVQSTDKVNASIVDFQDIDLTTLGDEAYYVITEDRTGVYKIAPDPERAPATHE